jgi:hypothetical protein
MSAKYHTTLQESPGQLIFGRDMIFNAQVMEIFLDKGGYKLTMEERLSIKVL